MELDLSRLSLAIKIQPTFEPEESYLLSCSTVKASGKINCYLIQGPDAVEPNVRPQKAGILIDDAKAKEILACVENLKISVVPDYILGLDGTRITVSITQGLNKVELFWWWKAPKQWEGVEKLVEMVREVAMAADETAGS